MNLSINLAMTKFEKPNVMKRTALSGGHFSLFPILVMAVVAKMAMPIVSEANGQESTTKIPQMRLMTTPDGHRYGVFCDKPEVPAATLFIFALGIEQMGSDPKRYYSQTGLDLAENGWIYVVLDPPCHGFDRNPDEPGELNGWAHQVRNGKDLIGPFVKRCSSVLDHLIQMGYSDPNRIAASGTSRGGFCALHFAANDARIKAVTGVSPVTNPLALSEFKDVTVEQTQAMNFESLADHLAGRSVWMSIGNSDNRVSTDDCVTLARTIVNRTRTFKPELAVIPIEILVGPSQGHRAVDDAYKLEAQFLRKHVK
ncbi:MAG: hypothetical protein FJ267_08335 [Planctomycetes bacterium]|nr:hypothetical protein [Planctomycetota bacterium]